MMHKLALTVYHNIHLTKEQRYRIHAGELVETIGVSVPVWVLGVKTSEPAKEIFCQYSIQCTGGEKAIQPTQSGYEITIPIRKLNLPSTRLSDEEWRHLNLKKPEALEAYYAKRQGEINTKSLLDIKDGGGACLIYREEGTFEHGNNVVRVMHYVIMEDVTVLEDSLC